MQTTHEQLAVTRELVIEASPETVWSFLVEPEKALRWMGIDVLVSEEEGSAYRCEVLPGHVALGEIIEAAPYRRLAFSWGWQQPEPGACRVGAARLLDRALRARARRDGNAAAIHAWRPAELRRRSRTTRPAGSTISPAS